MQFSNQYNMQQYQQPIYQNPYLDRQSQYQTMFPAQMSGTSPQPFYGKIVDSFDNIAVSDIPMNGQPATFIKADASEIQLKAWTSQGTISTKSYRPYEEQNEVEEHKNSVESLYEDFQSFKDEIFSRFDRLDKSVSAKSNSGSRNKREVESDE